jgi:cyanophycinase-like exopeptidase
VLAGIDERTALVWFEDGWRTMGDGAVTLVRADGERRFGSGERIVGIPAPHA